MARNIVLFSDGTGQAGGVRPDQRLSNIYKMYRASRIGPDSIIDPAQQIAFYDAGLGTDDDAGSALFGFIRTIRKTLASVTGRGITRNITDCYEFILNYYEPGDRIFIFGFSRGAYTARSLAGVLSLCGVPTIGADGRALPRHKPETRTIADEAVRKVYEHGAGREIAQYEGQRTELARRFRAKYGSDRDGEANVEPHFVGVFDTVASLGATGIRRVLLGAGLIAGLSLLSFAAGMIAHFTFGARLWTATALVLLLALAWFATSSIKSTLHVIKDYPGPGQWDWHFAKWKMKNYDRRLSPSVAFARHAIAIDETRADFPRVPWGFKSHQYVHVEGAPDVLQQLWFAGNHSDIGGSYPEEESRLSDIALDWMVGEATAIPGPLIVDRSRLQMFPDPGGIQHCEVDAMRDRIAAYAPSWWPKAWRLSWKEKPRLTVLGAPVHPSVVARFALDGVLKCGRLTPYRPVALRTDERFARYYSLPVE